uniref:Uncharacterized protein n=1 Tax=Oryza punctata TaxID=4537 RepID=A0A0E0JUI2_ORYPU
MFSSLRPHAAILSFSVTEETFRLVKSPPFAVSGVHLVELSAGKLCMVRDLRSISSMLEIWKLNDLYSSDWSSEHCIDLSTEHVARDLMKPDLIKAIGYQGRRRRRNNTCNQGNSFALPTAHSTLGMIGLFEESLAPVCKTNEEIALSSPLAKVIKGDSIPASGNTFTQEDHVFTVGLGFDPLMQCKSTYFIVEIFYRWRNFKTCHYHMTCSAFTCKTRRTHDVKQPPIPVSDMPPAYLAGFLYWMNCNQDNRSPCQSFEGILAEQELDIWKLEHGQWDRAYKVALAYSLGGAIAVVPMAVDPKDGRILLNTGRKLRLYHPTKRFRIWTSPLEHDRFFYEPPPALFRKISACFSDTSSSKEVNPLDNDIIPLVPIMYEDSLVSYPLPIKPRCLIR